MIEVIAASDSGDTELVLTGLGDQLQSLALHDWIHLLENTTHTLLQLIQRVKAARDVMLHAANVSAGKGATLGEVPNDCTDVSIDVYVLGFVYYSHLLTFFADGMCTRFCSAHVCRYIHGFAPKSFFSLI